MEHNDHTVKSVEVEKEVYHIYLDGQNLGLIPKSQIRHIIQQLDNVIS